MAGTLLKRDALNPNREIPESAEIRFYMLAGIGGQHGWRDPIRWIFASAS